MKEAIRIILAEDSPTQALGISSHLEEAGFAVEIASNGREVIEGITRQPPDIVVTDLEMPVMNGLELVEAVRDMSPPIPVILITAKGSEETAVAALQKGAASYVPKRQVAEHLVTTVREVLHMARANRSRERLMEFIKESETAFVIDNTSSVIPLLIGYLQESMAQLRICGETGLIRVGMALSEALENALYHGNLECGSPADQRRRSELAEERRAELPYRDRRIHIRARLTPGEAVFTIRDEGPGFEVSALPDSRKPDSLDIAGRGVMLMRTFMDEVHYNETGNQVTLVKRRENGAAITTAQSIEHAQNQGD